MKRCVMVAVCVLCGFTAVQAQDKKIPVPTPVEGPLLIPQVSDEEGLPPLPPLKDRPPLLLPPAPAEEEKISGTWPKPEQVSKLTGKYQAELFTALNGSERKAGIEECVFLVQGKKGNSIYGRFVTESGEFGAPTVIPCRKEIADLLTLTPKGHPEYHVFFLMGDNDLGAAIVAVRVKSPKAERIRKLVEPQKVIELPVYR